MSKKLSQKLIEKLEENTTIRLSYSNKCLLNDFLIETFFDARKKQHEATKKVCAENAKIKLYNEDLSGKEIDIYETDNYIECAKEMNSFAEISKNSILSVNMPDIS
jgi:hypothetical protein